MESTFAKQIALIERGFLPPVVKPNLILFEQLQMFVMQLMHIIFLLQLQIYPREAFNIGGTHHNG